MSDARWLDVDSDLTSAEHHFAMARKIAGEFDLGDYIYRMALLHAMEVGYTSVEAALERLFDMLDEELPGGPRWHHDLLRRAVRETPDRPAILSESMRRQLDELRGFRHVARHSYDATFRIDKADLALAAADATRTGLRKEIEAFRARIDPGA